MWQILDSKYGIFYPNFKLPFEFLNLKDHHFFMQIQSESLQ